MSFSDLKGRHAGQHGFIIGKGPSLDSIVKIIDQLNTGVVICLNESIRKVEPLVSAPLYVVQHDQTLENRCCPVSSATIHLIGYDVPKFPEPKSLGPIVRYDPGGFSDYGTTLSGADAIWIAKHMGIETLTFVAFDAWMKDMREDDSRIKYAGCIDPIPGYDPGHPFRHVGSGGEIRREALKAGLSWDTLHPNSGYHHCW